MRSLSGSLVCLLLLVFMVLMLVINPAQSQTNREKELESLLLKSQQYALDLEKKLELLKIECDSTKEVYEVQLNFERKTNEVKLEAANDKLELRRIFTDSIRVVEKEKYNEMKTFLMDKAKRRWYESPYLWLTVGFISGVVVDR